MNQKIVLFVALLAAPPIATRHLISKAKCVHQDKKDCQRCSKVRNAYLHLKNSTNSQKRKDRALYSSVVTADYCGTKFWLEHGGNLKRSFGDLYEETTEGTFLRIPVLAPIFEGSMFLPIGRSPKKVLDLLKKYGIDGFKNGPK